MDMARIEVIPNSAFKERCILRNNGQPSAQIEQTNGRRVNIINTNMARYWFDESEQG